MRIVLDASAAMHAITKSSFGDLIRSSLMQADQVLAPILYHAEISNGLLKYVKAGHLSIKDAEDKLDESLRFITEFHSIEDLKYDVLHEANRLNHSVYDIHYLVLVKRYGAHLMTFDKRLLALARQEELRYIQFEEIDWDWE